MLDTRLVPSLQRRLADWYARTKDDVSPWAFPVGIAVCALPPLVAAGRGYNSYLRYSWLVVIPAALIAGHLALALAFGARELVQLARRIPRRDGTRRWHIMRIGETVLFCLLFLAGWAAGLSWREIHCRRVRARCEPVLAAIDRYREDHGACPKNLADIPDFARLYAEAGIDLRQGRTNARAMLLQEAHVADAVIFLMPEKWVCIVPIERPMVFSLTRFYYYARESGGTWYLNYLIWTYGVI